MAALTERVIGVFYEVHAELGDGFPESVYEEAFAIALGQAGLCFDRQVPLSVWFRGQRVGDFRADYIVNDAVLVELKIAKTLGIAGRRWRTVRATETISLHSPLESAVTDGRSPGVGGANRDAPCHPW